tara:strand:+ start:823 stop:1506 length:684 start_codon:yes stop_codon:yes gene_type:complete
MSIYGYIRLNSRHRNPKNFDLIKQTKIIQTWSKNHDYKIKKILCEIEPNSTNMELPKLKKLISLIEQGKVSLLIIPRLDRLTRRIRLYQKLINLFKKYNIRFVSIEENLDSVTNNGKKVLETINYLALWDAKTISDRTHEMIEKKRKLGESVGHAPFGYIYQKKRLAPLVRELNIAKMIREKREEENLSYHKIARFLNSQRLRAKRGGKWYAETIKCICENPLYDRS